MSYQQTCNGVQQESATKGDVMDASDFRALIDSFDIQTNTEQQTECMLNNPKHPITVKNLRECMPLMAPGSLSGSASVDERRYASRGLLPFEANGTHFSMCK